jgi:hypothetical protein
MNTVTSAPGFFEITSLVCFVLAVLHTFLVKVFQRWALRFEEGSVGENFFHLLGEVEVVFGIWAGIFLSMLWVHSGSGVALQYLEGRNFTESLFVFVIMGICSTKPILLLAESLIQSISRLLPLPMVMSNYVVTLVLAPLLGSVITEPAAMTIAALLLAKNFFLHTKISEKLKYASLGLLFVNVSIGGTLTPYAAPPVLMVAGRWGWDLQFMLMHFGWEAALSILLSTAAVSFIFRKEFIRLSLDVVTDEQVSSSSLRIPFWVQALHLIFLLGVVIAAHHAVVFLGLFLFFLGLVSVTKEYQSELKIKEALLVGFFLAGLVVLGGPQRWWLEPIISNLSVLPLYFGTMSLTAVTDNAALTYLGSLVEGLSDSAKYALVAGSVIGGGLTVIANAPNPAGYGILNKYFGPEGISPLKLFLGALPPTIVAAVIFWP